MSYVVFFRVANLRYTGRRVPAKKQGKPYYYKQLDRL